MYMSNTNYVHIVFFSFEKKLSNSESIHLFMQYKYNNWFKNNLIIIKSIKQLIRAVKQSSVALIKNVMPIIVLEKRNHT